MIWRRLRITGDTSLADLHHIIQIAMGWENDYLHCFHIHGKDFGIVYSGGLSFSDDARGVHFDDFVFDVGDRFTYTYNFLDNWLNDVRIEAIENVSEVTYSVPYCISGMRRLCTDSVDNDDEETALFKVLDKIVNPDKSTTVGDIRSLIEDYEATRFNRQSINSNLTEAFTSQL